VVELLEAELDVVLVDVVTVEETEVLVELDETEVLDELDVVVELDEAVELVVARELSCNRSYLYI
jgi:hypothetical protein